MNVPVMFFGFDRVCGVFCGVCCYGIVMLMDRLGSYPSRKRKRKMWLQHLERHEKARDEEIANPESFRNERDVGYRDYIFAKFINI